MRNGLLCVVSWLVCVLLPSLFAQQSYVTICMDGATCSSVKIITTNPADIRSALTANQSPNVDLSGNLIEQLESIAFYGVRTLNLSYNLLNDVELNSNDLQVVDLTYNSVATIALPLNINTFIAKRNQLHKITFTNSRQVLHLMLAQNHFSSLKDFSNLENLRTLDLSCNRIQELSFTTISKLKKLEDLNLDNNQVYMMEATGSFPMLSKLSLSNNYLSAFVDTRDQMPNIKVLKLDHNHIVAGLQRIRGIEQLSISGNDWDCGKLTKILNDNVVVDRDPPGCPEQRRDICCSSTSGPFADRVIKARQQLFHKSQQDISHHESGADCSQYRPHVCDGDDNKVYEVAQSILTDGLSSAQSNAQRLNSTILRKESMLNSKRMEFQKDNALFLQVNDELSDVESLIEEEYQMLPIKKSRSASAGEKLKLIMEAYENESIGTRERIHSEERKEQDIVDKLAKVQEENNEQNEISEDLRANIAGRNETLVSLGKEIIELQKILDARQQQKSG